MAFMLISCDCRMVPRLIIFFTVIAGIHLLITYVPSCNILHNI